MKVPTEAEIEAFFVSVYGKEGEAIMEQVRALKKKRAINSVESDRLEHAQRQPERPAPDLSDEWWNK